jgi:hypothetical protein
MTTALPDPRLVPSRTCLAVPSEDIAVCAPPLVQLTDARHVVAESPLPHNLSVFGHDADIVMSFRPVHATKITERLLTFACERAQGGSTET